GSSTQDACGICDDNPNNDNSTCSGCTDVNAENYDDSAVFDDGSCEYSDNVFSVPLEYSSIQSAINYAGDGDIVEVGPGTYHENINFQGKAITLQSQYENSGSIEDYIISAVDSASTITIENVANDGAVVKGFTITGGYGRGVSFEDFISLAADPEAFDSLITQVLRGGGISVGNASPLLQDLIITENSARNVGAGLGLVNSNALVQSVLITNNTIPDGDALGGGGIAVNGGHPILDEVTISENVVGTNQYFLNGGGGILCGFSFNGEVLQLDINNSRIFGNIANIGGGFGALSGNISFHRVLIANNTGDYGSALSLGEPLGLAINDITLNILNSTIAHNNGLLGVGMINSAEINTVNSIFWNNGQTEFSPLPNNDQLNVNMTHSNAEDEWTGAGNISSDPMFASPTTSDFTLIADSPCIDAGTIDTNGDGIQDIFDFSGSAPDMGAFEYSESECGVTGDVNNDSAINILDIVNVINLILSNQFDACADLNSDSSINILDIVLIVNLILE
ncbi:MAG: dockerin type I domain-containing protein, partial [Candidatus Marinimicrobia bacterium]|nr:dockerin type I domain-containing protein [Candidatus Neomarinimicrobiota bacterium]